MKILVKNSKGTTGVTVVSKHLWHGLLDNEITIADNDVIFNLKYTDENDLFICVLNNLDELNINRTTTETLLNLVLEYLVLGIGYHISYKYGDDNDVDSSEYMEQINLNVTDCIDEICSAILDDKQFIPESSYSATDNYSRLEEVWCKVKHKGTVEFNHILEELLMYITSIMEDMFDVISVEKKDVSRSLSLLTLTVPIVMRFDLYKCIFLCTILNRYEESVGE